MKGIEKNLAKTYPYKLPAGGLGWAPSAAIRGGGERPWQATAAAHRRRGRKAREAMHNYYPIWAGLVLISLLLARPAPAQMPNGSQFQVNAYTTSYQRLPAVATTSSGAFVVVWESEGSSGTDTSNNSIQGQRYGGPVPVELLRFEVK